MFKNVNSRVFSSFFLSLVFVISCMATASAANREFTKDPDGNKGSQGGQVAQASPVPIDGSVSKSLDLGTNEGAAECIADCGDGSGWWCSGDRVSCSDGVGCYAEGDDGSFAGGSCNAN
jgi:hypothetical protein